MTALVASDARAQVVGRALSLAGDLNLTAFNVNADGDAFPNVDRAPTAVLDGINDSGTSRFDWFGTVTRDADFQTRTTEGATISSDILDDSLAAFPSDSFGLVKGGSETVPGDLTPGFFIQDVVNPDTSNNAATVQQATWTFNTAAATGNLSLSVDFAAMGDFEAADVITIAVSTNGGASFTTLFTSGIIDTAFTLAPDPNFPGFVDTTVAGQDLAGLPADVKYTLESGLTVALNDPLTMNGTRLSNEFATFTASIGPAASTLIVRVNATADGGNEVTGFRNIVISQAGSPTPQAGDFSGDGKVDGADLSLLLANWGSTVPPTPSGWTGDLPTATGIDADELSRLLANWGFGTSTAIPEPSSLAIVAVALCGFARRRNG
jgi:hypothetical protein